MSGEGEEWEVVRTVGTEEEATVVVGFLQSSGIPAQVESLHIREIPVDFGDMSQVRVRVPADRADEATELLASIDVGDASRRDAPE
ncbi:MAG TPA: hypothetical protein VIH93_10380 [Thermoanaerobaculia bacterium]|jgi:hypothetical protein